MFKKIFSGVIALSLVVSTLTLPAYARSLNKKQLPSGNDFSFSASQQYMIDQRIMRGDGKGNYNAYMSGNLNRGALMVMLVRAFDFSSNFNDSSDSFTDVPSNNYYANAINTAKKLGIARGYGKSFRPNSYVTIQEAILFIERSAEKSGITLSSDLESYFDSSELNDYATRDDIANLLYYILTGDESGLDDSESTDTETADTITYTSSNGAVVDFAESTFSEAVDEATDGETLSYVIFSLPSSKCGTLYYNYSSSSSTNAKVSANTKYYADQEKYLSDVTFVPNTSYMGYTGTVTIRYTGYTTAETAVSGLIQIIVKNAEASAFSYDYDADEDDYILFDSSDFTSACEDALGDDYTLSYVTFTLPSDSEGNLYYDYSTSSESGTAMTKTTNCYLSSSPELSNVAFVNYSSNDDDVAISYTGHTTDGAIFTGSIEINVD